MNEWYRYGGTAGRLSYRPCDQLPCKIRWSTASNLAVSRATEYAFAVTNAVTKQEALVSGQVVLIKPTGERSTYICGSF